MTETEYLWLGISLGMAFMGFCWWLQARSYGEVLVMCAKSRTAEKLPDGGFYYIVAELEYVEMTAARLRDKPPAMKEFYFHDRQP